MLFKSTQLKNCPCFLSGGMVVVVVGRGGGGTGGVSIYVSCLGMCNSCLQLQLWGHLGSFAYFLFFKWISLEHKTRIYIILIFLVPPSPFRHSLYRSIESNFICSSYYSNIDFKQPSFLNFQLICHWLSSFECIYYLHAFHELIYSYPDWHRVGIGDSQVKLGQFRLNRSGWTLCKDFRGLRGMLSGRK